MPTDDTSIYYDVKDVVFCLFGEAKVPRSSTASIESANSHSYSSKSGASSLIANDLLYDLFW